jgi:rod shape-determining protein MreD
MVRDALGSTRRIGAGPVTAAGLVPAASVLVGSLLSSLPIVVESGWFPDFGFLMLLAWRLLRADAWPTWWAAPLGLANDLLTGFPIGLSVTIWTASMLVLDVVDRRTIWRDYWIEWGLAAVLILFSSVAHWQVAKWMGAAVPFSAMIPSIVISVAAFPVAAWLAGRIDRWRLGRQ